MVKIYKITKLDGKQPVPSKQIVASEEIINNECVKKKSAMKKDFRKYLKFTPAL